ncbi:hypothetical protein AB6A40_001105 [Gnathostoma spinigerum]|uniref:RxLR effector protein n=1 Tax=Gnathostoma spinigerum TaxID=75299 RepID=A0ABD6EAE5_9BILA
MRFQLFLLILLAALLSTIVSSQEYSEVQTTDGLVPVDEGSKGNLEEHVRQKRASNYYTSMNQLQTFSILQKLADCEDSTYAGDGSRKHLFTRILHLIKV